MKSAMTNVEISAIIEAGWADDVSFERIKVDTGLSEREVKAVMRKHLKSGSYVAWRKRVSGQKPKHEKRQRDLDTRSR